MKKILFLGDSRSIHLKRWINYFENRGYKTSLATFTSPNLTECKNCIYLSKQKFKVEGKNFHYLFGLIKLVRYIQKIRPDFINAHFSYSYGFLGIFACRLARLKPIFSVVCHGSDVLNGSIPMLTNIINKWVFKKTDSIIAVSDQINDRLHEMGVHGEKILKIQYGLDVKTQVVIEKKDIDIISTRDFTKNSRIEEMIEQIKFIKKKEIRIVFVMSKINKNDFERLTKKYKWICFFKDLQNEKVVSLINRSLFYISATKSDGTSISLLEALAGGAFPILSNIPANRSWVVDGINGKLFDTLKQFKLDIQDCLKLDKKILKNTAEMNRRLISMKADYNKNMEIIERHILNTKKL